MAIPIHALGRVLHVFAWPPTRRGEREQSLVRGLSDSLSARSSEDKISVMASGRLVYRLAPTYGRCVMGNTVTRGPSYSKDALEVGPPILEAL